MICCWRWFIHPDDGDQHESKRVHDSRHLVSSVSRVPIRRANKSADSSRSSFRAIRDAIIQSTAEQNEARQRLTTIPGIGPVTATALIAAIGNGSGFRRGKDLAAWVGIVPRQPSPRSRQPKEERRPLLLAPKQRDVSDAIAKGSRPCFPSSQDWFFQNDMF
jgi:hypothetical protein